jgi:predicted enzyme related to lactoylglutathione lyase
MAEPFGLAQIGQIAINVKDVERATDFYREKLGLKHLFAVSGLSFFDAGGVRLMLSRAEKPEFDHPASVLYFKVENLDDAYRTLLERGVNFEGKPHMIADMKTYELWMADFRDSEENLFCLMSEVAK